jgi:nucleotide-binding universal stress UspA family protein
MQPTTAEMQIGSGPITRPMAGKLRLVTVADLDGRTRASRRARELATTFAEEIGGSLSSAQRLAVERAAALSALAEDARVRHLAGDTSVSLEDIVRIDNASARAVKALGLGARKREQKPGAALAEYLARAAVPEPSA